MSDPTTRTVTSPAGEQIEVFADNDWLTLTGEDETSLRQWKGRGEMIATLWFYGKVEEASGRAMSIVHQRMVDEFGYEARQAAITSFWHAESMRTAVARKVQGKRTYSVQLVAIPERWRAILVNSYPKHQPPTIEPERLKLTVPTGPPEWEPHSVVEPLQVEPEPEPAPPLEDAATLVATSLLNQVIELIQAGGTTNERGKIARLESDLGEAAGRLSTTLSENDRMRKQIKSLGEQVVALTHERDGLMKRLHMAEENIRRATPLTQRVVDERMQHELERMMREPPKTKGD